MKKTPSSRSTPASQKKGFSLIEILVVLGIIAALVGVVVQTTGGSQARGKAVADQETLTAIQTAADRFVSEYGTVPTVWHATNVSNKIFSATEVTNMMQTLTGTLPSATDATVSAYCATNPVMRLNDDVTQYANRLTAVYSTTGTGNPALGRIVILQYRKSSTGMVVNGDGTISTALIAATTAIVPDFFNTTTNTGVWTGKAAWPF